ncbi:MAG: hypothetical protein IE921_17505 [Rhodobacteraceae bacterium]|nr:hypothetical protein [Paracoccaceae bacterium]
MSNHIGFEARTLARRNLKGEGKTAGFERIGDWLVSGDRSDLADIRKAKVRRQHPTQLEPFQNPHQNGCSC